LATPLFFFDWHCEGFASLLKSAAIADTSLCTAKGRRAQSSGTHERPYST